MSRLVLGAVSALLLAGSGLFWWQGRASIDTAAPPPPPVSVQPIAEAALDAIPDEDGEGFQGAELPQADEPAREERRFNRIDRNRDNLINRAEALQPRIAAFRKLDKDSNNLLSFEEWAVVSSNRFRMADADGNGTLTRPEFATTKPRPVRKPACRC